MSMIAMLWLAVAGAEPAAEAMPTIVTHAEGRGLAVRTSDYPRAALKAGEGGHTVTRILIGANGRVQDCQVTQSSGSAALDSRTCEIATRGRYKAARDATGASVPEWWHWAIKWVAKGGPIIVIDDTRPESVPEPRRIVGQTKWDSLPPMTVGRSARTPGDLNLRVARILESGQCKLGDNRPGRFDVFVRLALEMTPQGDIHSVLVEDLGCRPLEMLVANAVLAPGFRKAIQPPGGNEKRWYGYGFKFTGP